MSIEVICESCGALLHLNARLAGRRVRCQQCDAQITVPEPAMVESDSPATSDGENALDSLSTAAVSDAPVPDAPVPDAPVPDAQPIEGEALEPSGGDRVEFAHDPIFDSPGHHSATDMPTLPPSMQSESEEDDPPKRAKRKEDELDMTPMVDVTFLLLIFFMVTASFSLQKSIAMPRQQSDAPSTTVKEEEEEDDDMVTVQIDEFGSFLVLASDWERETPGKQNLTTALREAISPFSGAVRLVIEVHEDAKLKYLVDCMDAGTICNYAEIQVTQVDGFD